MLTSIIMIKPIGGRGKKAPYETTHLRIPLPIKDKVEKMINDYRSEILEGIKTNFEIKLSLEDAKLLTRKILQAKKQSKIEAMANLLTSIYGIEITKQDLES